MSKITIDFFDEKKTIRKPNSFNELMEMLKKEYNIRKDDLGGMRLRYTDSEGDEVCLDNEEDFRIFADSLEENENNTISVFFPEESFLFQSYVSQVSNHPRETQQENDVPNHPNQSKEKDNFLDGLVNFIRKFFG